MNKKNEKWYAEGTVDIVERGKWKYKCLRKLFRSAIAALPTELIRFRKYPHARLCVLNTRCKCGVVVQCSAALPLPI